LSWVFIFTSLLSWGGVSMAISIACFAVLPQGHVKTPTFIPIEDAIQLFVIIFDLLQKLSTNFPSLL
jgi:hypothetical protein